MDRNSGTVAGLAKAILAYDDEFMTVLVNGRSVEQEKADYAWATIIKQATLLEAAPAGTAQRSKDRQGNFVERSKVVARQICEHLNVPYDRHGWLPDYLQNLMLSVDEDALAAALATPSPQAPANEKPPQHPFEVRISIGGDDWEYIRRAVRDLLEHVESREPNEVGCSSGGGGGCHSIDLQRRDVPVKQFREELQAWHERLRAAKESK